MLVICWNTKVGQRKNGLRTTTGSNIIQRQNGTRLNKRTVLSLFGKSECLSVPRFHKLESTSVHDESVDLVHSCIQSFEYLCDFARVRAAPRIANYMLAVLLSFYLCNVGSYNGNM